MNGRQILIPATAAILGFSLGVLVSTHRSSASPSGPEPAKALHLKTGPGISQENPAEENSHAPLKSRVREQTTSAKPKSRQISVPFDAIVPILKQRQFSYQDFMQIDGALDSALTMLGVVDPERQEVKAIIDSTRARLLEAERTHIKVEQSDANNLVLDQSSMKNLVPGIVSETQNKLRSSLSPDLGEALVGSIDWQNFYTHQNDFERKISFSITRNNNGSLSATHRFGTGSTSRGLLPENFPDDGNPHTIAEFFDARWKPFLEGIEMLPAEDSQ